MPQASDELRAKFPNGDAEAMEVLDANFIIDDKGFIRFKDRTYEMTEREGDAIDYLCDEWDYGFGGDINATKE